MSALARHLCWRPNELNDTLAIDAAVPSDSVFLATHHPARIYRGDVRLATSGLQGAPDATPVSEQELLQDLLSSDADPLLLPIIGASGSGKSHLVRWLKAAIDPNEARWHVIYVPKYRTSLRGVIESITGGFEGAEFREIEETLRRTADSLNEEQAPADLLNKLAAAFETATPQHAPLSLTPSPKTRHREYLIGSSGFAALLYDASFREALLAERGIIRQFVQQALHGREEHDTGEPFQFTIQDLPIQAFNYHAAGLVAKTFFSRFSNDLELQELAAEMLTEFLQVAIRSLIGVQTDQLGVLFQRVRLLLGTEGKELILLIEDFSVLQGIQRELLDALLVPAMQQGERRFCPLRTAMAVTDGYFLKLLSTVQTRVRWVYSLDVSLEKVPERDIVSFVARYLNAARLGAQPIAVGRGTVTEIEDTSWVPNACDACPCQPECHPAFGTSREGYGLYPLNQTALVRAVGAKLRRSPAQTFDPRTILSGVVWDVLNVRAPAIGRGEFPDPQFGEEFYDPEVVPGLSTPTERRLQSVDPINASRRKILLTYYAEHPNDPADLPGALYRAFGLSEVPVSSGAGELQGPNVSVVPIHGTPLPPIVQSTESVTEERTPTPSPLPPVDEVLQDNLGWVQRWSHGEELPQALRRTIRSRIHEAVLEAIEAESLPLITKKWFERAGFFSNEKIGFGGLSDQTEVLFTLHASELDDRQSLEAIVQFEHYGHWRFRDGAEYYRVLRRSVVRWAAPVRKKVDESLAQVDIDALVQTLLIGAAVHGLEGADAEGTTRLVGTFLCELPTSRGPTATLWEQLERICVAGGTGIDPRKVLADTLIRRVSAFKGESNKPQALDAATLRDSIARVLADPSSPHSASTAAPTGPHLARVLDLLQPAVRERRERLTRWKAHITGLVGDSITDATLLVDNVDGALAAAAPMVALEDPGSRQQVKRMAIQFTNANPGELLEQVTRALDRMDTVDLRSHLVDLARIPDADLEAVRAYLDRVDFELAGLERKLASSHDEAEHLRQAILATQAEFVHEAGGVADDLEHSVPEFEDPKAEPTDHSLEIA